MNVASPPYRFALPSEAIDPAVDKLNSFATLPVGWRYGQGGPISEDIIRAARSIYKLLRLVGFYRNDFFAGESGEVLVTAYRRHTYVGVVIEPNGKNSVVYEENGDEKLFLENLSLSQVCGELIKLAGKLWNISDLHTPMTMTIQGGSSTTLPLSPQQTGAGSRSSRLPAQKQPA